MVAGSGVLWAWSPGRQPFRRQHLLLGFWQLGAFYWESFVCHCSTARKLKWRARHGPERGLRVPIAVLQVVILNCCTPANEVMRHHLAFGAAALITSSQPSPVPTTPGSFLCFTLIDQIRGKWGGCPWRPDALGFSDADDDFCSGPGSADYKAVPGGRLGAQEAA